MTFGVNANIPPLCGGDVG